MFYCNIRYEVGKRKVRNKKDGETSKLKYKVKRETKVPFYHTLMQLPRHGNGIIKV